MKWLPLTVSLVATATSGPAIAGSQWSPEFRIVALEVKEASGVLRIGVRRRIELGLSPLMFNPAGCAAITKRFDVGGTDTSLRIFDLALGARGRSKALQRQMLNSIYAAFATNQVVTISVRDDRCTAIENSPYVSGVSVLY